MNHDAFCFFVRRRKFYVLSKIDVKDVFEELMSRRVEISSTCLDDNVGQPGTKDNIRRVRRDFRSCTDDFLTGCIHFWECTSLNRIDTMKVFSIFVITRNIVHITKWPNKNGGNNNVPVEEFRDRM